MEFIEYGDLEQYLKAPVPEKEACLITSQVVEGLKYMHGSGFAHRDLKPANLLVYKPGPHWWIKIGDLGISKRQDDGTVLRTLVGTPAFLAPEILGLIPTEADGSYTFAVDIWSLGQIVAQMLSGQPLFPNMPAMTPYVMGLKPFESFIGHMAEFGIGDIALHFLCKLLAPTPGERMSAEEAAEHAWLADMDGSSSGSDDGFEGISHADSSKA